MSRKKFLCLDCKVDTGKIAEYYLLKDSVWLVANPDYAGMLCIECCERRLGRKLVFDDFSEVSVRLQERMKR